MDKTIIIRVRSYQWENKLSLDDRKRLVGWYQEGYAIRNIAMTLRLTIPTVQYHLKAAGAFVPNKRPVLWNKSINVPKREPLLQSRRLTLNEVVLVDKLALHSLAHLGKEELRQIKFESNMPKSYREYVEQEKQRREQRKQAFIEEQRRKKVSLCQEH